MGEETKVAVRNVRREAIEKLKAKKKASELTEDEVKDGEKQVQDLTDKYVAEIDKMVNCKGSGDHEHLIALTRKPAAE